MSSPPAPSPPPLPETNATTLPSTNTTNGTTAPQPPKGGLPPGTMAGLIVGVGLGAIFVLVGVGIIVVLRKRRKRRRRRKMGEGFYGGPAQEPTGDPYVDQHWQHNVPRPTENKMPSPIGFPFNPQKSPVLVPTPPEPHSSNGNLGSEKTAPGIVFGFPQSIFTYEELARATNGFSDLNLLGQGGFGYVHKGVLPNGKVVAIKQLKVGSGQGEREFQAEVEIISRIHHRHLVSLVGYCITGAHRMLVYEFVPNNTLEFHLHGKEGPTMDWATRVKISVGAAKGLAYLHEDCHPKIIHRDVKAANILLDDNFEAKVADFGLAKSSLDTETHVSTRVMGTFGYMAPEYASTGKLTDKSDVFSFGVVLLEIITGHRPVDKKQSFFDDSIVDWARPLLNQALEDGNYDALVDPKLQKGYDYNEMARMIACAAASVRHSAKFRPRMSQIVRALEGNMSLDDLNERITPGQSTAFGSYASSDYSSCQYKEDLKKFKKMALESQDLGSSGYSGPTSESGLQASSSSTEGQQITQEMELKKMEKQTKEIG